jgi:hypothetical protein
MSAAKDLDLNSEEAPFMGMPSIPNSFYPLLYNLAAPSRHYHREAVKAIGPFSLFAFVVCSPDEVGGVRGVLEKHFSFLDLATADRLLFYAPVDEPPQWREQRTGHEASHALLQFHDFINYSCHSKDPPGTQHALAVTLGLELHDLPALVLTTDPQRADFVVLRTCADHIRRQLLALGDLAQDITPIQERTGDGAAYRLDPGDLRRRGLDLCAGIYSPELVESLAEALHQVLSMALTHGGDRDHQYYASQSVRRLLEGLRAKLERARRAVRSTGGPGPGDAPDGEDDPTWHLLERLACYLPLLAGEGTVSTTTDVPGGWDAQSSRWVRLGDQVEELLAGLPHQSFLDLDPFLQESRRHRAFLKLNPHHREAVRGVVPAAGQQDTGPVADFSPAAVCWTKAFEAEMQHSLGHWVRGLLGVELPRYFGRVQEGVNAVFSNSDGTFKVDFNRRRRPGDDDWKPPELGPLQGPVRYYLQHQAPAPLDEASQMTLFGAWETVRQVRNDVCHAYAVPQDRATLVRRVIRELEEAHVLDDLARLKARLRGDSPAAKGSKATHAVMTPQAPRAEATPKRWWQFWR